MLQFAIACLAIALIALVFDFRVLKARGAACWRESANLKPRGHRDEMGPDHGALATLDEQSAMDVGHEQPIAGDPAMNTQRYVGVVEHRNGRWVAVFAVAFPQSDADQGPRYYFSLEAAKSEVLAYLAAKKVGFLARWHERRYVNGKLVIP